MNILVIDVGGSHVKLFATGQTKSRQFDSGPKFTPQQLLDEVLHHVGDWPFDGVSLGLPCRVGRSGPAVEPGNLGDGWVGFDYAKAFNKPVRVVNDAALQALGAYQRGRMLFLGLGTGLGSALVAAERVVIPLELGGLRYSFEDNLGERLGKKGLERYGEKQWVQVISDTVQELRNAFSADEVVIGGGNAARIVARPDWIRLGSNDDAFTGGFRLWEETVEAHDVPLANSWRVVI